MINKYVALGLLTVFVAGCGSSPPAQEPASGEIIAYADGFFRPEPGENGSTFRWMGPEGVVKLRNTHQPMVLTVRGRAPVEQLPQNPTISLQFNGQPLEEIQAEADTVERVYRIPVAQQGSGDWSELRIKTTQSLVPHEVNPQVADGRRLGFNLHGLSWETDQ